MLAEILDLLLGGHSAGRLAAAVAGLLLVWYLVQWGLDERRIRRLGVHAPVKHGLPMGERRPSSPASVSLAPTPADSLFPPPPGVDFVFRALVAARRNQHMELWQNNFKTYCTDTIELYPGNRRVIFTDDPENMKAILATQFQDFGKGEPFRLEWHDFLGDSIFTTDLGQWHSSRQLLRPLFIKDRVSDLKVFETHVAKLFEKVGRRGQTHDLSDLFFRYTLDAATDYLLGSSVGSLDDPQVKFAEAFAEVQHVQSIITRSG